MFTITIEEVVPMDSDRAGDARRVLTRYEQVVDHLDVRAVIAVVNRPHGYIDVRRSSEGQVRLGNDL